METSRLLKRRRSVSPSSDASESMSYPRAMRHLPKRRLVELSHVEKPLLRPSLLSHRGGYSGVLSSSDTDTDGTSEDELGTALSDVESEVRAGDHYEVSPDRDDEEIDVVLMTSKTAPSSPCGPVWVAEKGKAVDPREHGERSRKRRRTSSPDSGSDGEGDDEREAADFMLFDRKRRTLLGPGSGRRTSHRPLPLHLVHSHLGPTKSIMEITKCMDGLAADSAFEIEVEYQLDSDEDLVSADLVLESSPTPRSAQTTPSLPTLRRRTTAKGVTWNARHEKRFQPMALNASDPILDMKAMMAYPEDYKELIEEEFMITSDVEAEAGLISCREQCTTAKEKEVIMTNDLDVKLVPREVQQRPQHCSYPRRLPGQKSTSHLRRYSPTSLLPRREKHLSSPHLHSSRHETVRFTAGPCLTGQAWIEVLHSRRAAQLHRRDLLLKFNERTKDGYWREKMGKWTMYDWVVASSKPWWIKIVTTPEEEYEVEGLLPPADVDGEVDAIAVDAFLYPETEVILSRKRAPLSGPGYGDEVSARWARRNELRLREEVRPHVDRIRARRALRINEVHRTRAERATAAHLRILAERIRRDGADQRDAAIELRQIASSVPTLELVRQNETTPESRETSSSPDPSEPPEYEFPFYPVVIPVPAHLRIRSSAPSRRTRGTSPPDYIRNMRYRSTSPSPPPPYNASTDRETLVAPIFIEDDPEEEAMLSRIRPSGLFRSPSPEQTIVGAFPEEQTLVRGSTRSAWDAALDLEEGEEDMVEGSFHDEERDVTEQVPVLGTISRLLGRVWRW